MSNYTNKVCPFCKTEFAETDDVVVCSVCDMPHHKDCWVENQGCTTFGCTGTIKTADNSPSPIITNETGYNNAPAQPTNNIFCTKCGAPNASTYSFCSKCGNKLTPIEQPVTPYVQAQPVIINKGTTFPYQGNNTAGNINTTYTNPQPQQATINSHNEAIDPDIVQLIGDKSQYYIPAYQKIKTQNNKISWNWASFIFGPSWFMYRKMYIYAAAIWGVNLLITLALGSSASFISLIISVASGLLGNYLYSLHLDKHAAQMKNLDENGKSQYANKNGKTSILASIGGAIAYGVILSIISNL